MIWLTKLSISAKAANYKLRSDAKIHVLGFLLVVICAIIKKNAIGIWSRTDIRFPFCNSKYIVLDHHKVDKAIKELINNNSAINSKRVLIG